MTWPPGWNVSCVRLYHLTWCEERCEVKTGWRQYRNPFWYGTFLVVMYTWTDSSDSKSVLAWNLSLWILGKSRGKYSRARCLMSSMGPLLSFCGNADSNFSKRQSERKITLTRFWKIRYEGTYVSQVQANRRFNKRRRKKVEWRKTRKYVLGSFQDVTFS